MEHDSFRALVPGGEIEGDGVSLRPVTIGDCTARYVEWLGDPLVNRYLETRWHRQDLAAVSAFVRDMTASPDNLLLAILERAGGTHIGNIKLGPVNRRHSFADVSYFIGERACWGRGFATEAIRLVVRLAFDRMGLHRLQAGLYDGNVASQKALERAGFRRDGSFSKQLWLDDEVGYVDHVWMYILNE